MVSSSLASTIAMASLTVAAAAAAAAAATVAAESSSSSTSSSSTSSTTTTTAAAAAAAAGMPFIRMKDLPGVAHPETAQWTSLTKQVEFLPVDQLPQPKHNARRAGATQAKANAKTAAARTTTRRTEDQAEEGNDDATDDAATATATATDDEGDGDTMDDDARNPYRVQPFVAGIEEYDEYQQAWRMLGFMVDCNDYQNGFDDDANQNSGSGDYETTEEGCHRYVLWAAYVDLEYEGAGIAEYQYWNQDYQKWDKSACGYTDDGSSSRCAKMDCHKEDTHFSLLGFFKHRNYDDWMEQLFKHEGYCVWDEEQYAFMDNARNVWPQGCTVVEDATAEDGQALYYDLKPLPKGRITVGLYLDAQCTQDYSSNTDLVEGILGNFFVNGGGNSNSGDNGDYDFSSDTLAQSLSRWESAFSVWNTCQPCVAYDLQNTDGSTYTDDYYYNDDGNNNYWYNYYNYNNNNNNGNRARKMGGEYSAQGETFECYDNAGYTNVNQCMKFSAKTTMNTATFRDMYLARAQGTLAQSPLSGFLVNSKGKFYRDTFGSLLTYLSFLGTIVCCCYASTYCYRQKRDTKYDLRELKHLLKRNHHNGSGSGGTGEGPREAMVVKGDTQELS